MATPTHRLTIGLLMALVVVVVLGGISAVAIARQHGQTAGVASPDSSAPRSSVAGVPLGSPSSTKVSATSTSSVGQKTDSTSAPAQSGAPSSAVGNSDPAVDSDPTSAPAGPSNNLTVQMSPAARTQARAQDVQHALQSYFDAINQHDYAGWTQAVTKALASHQTSAQWLSAYATTVDSSIWMQTLRDDPLRVQVRFTSQQDPDLGPADLQVDCIHWTLTFAVAEQGGQLMIGSTVDGSVRYVKC